MLAILLAMGLSLGKSARQRIRIPLEGVRQLAEGWYRLEAGRRVEVQIPGTVTLDSGEALALYYDGLNPTDAGLVLTTRGAVYRLRVDLGEELLYAYDDSTFRRNEQMRAKLDCDVVLPEETGGQPLILTYENAGDGRFALPAVYLGSSSAVFRQHCLGDAFTLLLVFTMAIISVVAIGIASYLDKVRMQDRRFADVACFLLLCGAWCTLDSSLMQQISGQSPLVCYLSFYVFMTLAIPMLHFVRNTGEMCRFRSLDVLIGAFYVNAVGQSLLNFFWGFDFIDMLFVTHLLLAAGICLMGVLMLREYRRTGNREMQAVLRAFVMLAAGGALALLLYWLLETPWYGTIFECGILVFIICLLSSLISTMAANLRFKTEVQVYKRLSREDRLTGLENRRTFKEFLARLEQETGSYGNVALIFLDLDGLKYTNDHFGHSAGDELLIGAARCIEQAFCRQGSCYRIGGDEFAVILPDPAGDERAWNEQLDQAIRQYNQDSRFWLSIARGSSYLRDEAGDIKRMSDWKYEADQAMYRHKKQQRSRRQGSARAAVAGREQDSAGGFLG